MSITLAQSNEMHIARLDLHRRDHLAAVKLPAAERKIERAMVKLASVMAMELINEMSNA